MTFRSFVQCVPLKINIRFEICVVLYKYVNTTNNVECTLEAGCSTVHLCP